MSIPQLRIVTYLCPSIPVELFQSILEVLERKTGYQTTLQYEWQSDGYSEDRIDVFQSNLVDLAFMPSSGYISLKANSTTFAELLPVTPIFKHMKSDQQNAETYIDVIVHSDKLKHSIREILDLRGCRWACVENSVADAIMMTEIKKLGENITFFGSCHRPSSHLAAVNMVLTKQVDVATIDSSALTCNKRFLHNGAKDVVVLTSFGPLAPYAVVINNRINGELKSKIIAALNSINNKDVHFGRFGLIRFVANHTNNYKTESEFMKTTQGSAAKVPYY